MENRLIRVICAAWLALALGARVVAAAEPQLPTVEVWKTPTCGCCTVWVRHLEEAGLKVKVTEMDDLTPIRRQFRVPPELSSCHTARVGGYVVEGHVPAEDVLRLLTTRPQITGIYVPGMPIGSPGMEGPDAEAFQVLALDAAGRKSVFATHTP